MKEKAAALASLDEIHTKIEALGQDREPFAEKLVVGISLASQMLRTLLEVEGKPYDANADLLMLWKTLTKGASHWNTIRDNCRELIYYQNCLAMDRVDALPPAPEKMMIHILRHLYLYARSHIEQLQEELS